MSDGIAASVTSAAAAARPLTFVPRPAQEDAARAEFYALLARLWYAGPDRALLATLAAADEITPEAEASELAAAWRALVAAAGATDEEAARLEYDEVFVGIGRAPVSMFSTAYLAGAFKERVVVQLRDELAALGLQRTPRAREPEDHLAALCDVMRHLIGAGSDAESLERQQRFFQRYLEPAYAPFTAAAQAAAGARFYRHVARFTKAFLDLEVQSFQML
jgi:TorA maturation chaperone TorD